MHKLTVEDVALANQQVLMRVDFNVPIKDGKVVNDKRIRAALPTIRYVLSQGGKLVLMSHLGRPKGQRRAEMSLRPCAETLALHLNQAVGFVDDCIGEKVEAAVQKLAPGQVLLLENLRFYAGETQNDALFAKQLAGSADLYINDAFGTAHRAHASTVGVIRHLRIAAAGYLMMKEIDYLGRALQAPQTPFVAILGGAKISGKIDVIQSLLTKVDRLLIGGGMAYTFLYAQGLSVGNSLLETDKVALAKSLLAEAGDKIVLPVDCMVSDTFDFEAGTVASLQAVDVGAIPDGFAGLDIGPASIERFQAVLADARTVVWNGPMGVFEIEATAKGTFDIARMLAQLTDAGAVTIIGGGDSAAAAEKAGVAERISHISTGGGASLQFLEGKTLPGIAALNDK
jgi:phosphoglycerate kinase